VPREVPSTVSCRMVASWTSSFLTKGCCKVPLYSSLLTALAPAPNSSSPLPSADLATAPNVVVDACVCVYVHVKVCVGVCASSVRVSVRENM